jgi:hypothetical protein
MFDYFLQVSGWGLTAGFLCLEVRQRCFGRCLGLGPLQVSGRGHGWGLTWGLAAGFSGLDTRQGCSGGCLGGGGLGMGHQCF